MDLEDISFLVFGFNIKSFATSSIVRPTAAPQVVMEPAINSARALRDYLGGLTVSNVPKPILNWSACNKRGK